MTERDEALELIAVASRCGLCGAYTPDDCSKGHVPEEELLFDEDALRAEAAQELRAMADEIHEFWKSEFKRDPTEGNSVSHGCVASMKLLRARADEIEAGND